MKFVFSLLVLLLVAAFAAQAKTAVKTARKCGSEHAPILLVVFLTLFPPSPLCLYVRVLICV
jgi:uncharacterized integral membrane protein